MDYYTAIDDGMKIEEILRLFFMHPLTRRQEERYATEFSEQTAEKMMSLLVETPIQEIFNIIYSHRDEIREIKTIEIPQFSNINDIDKVLAIVKSNPECTYQLIGYFFNKEGKEYSQWKYGENHYKGAVALGLAEAGKPFALSPLGEKYITSTREEREIIKPKLCLLVPIVQEILVNGYDGPYHAMIILRSLLSEKTAVRRRSSIKQIIRAIEAAMPEADFIQKNLIWE